MLDLRIYRAGFVAVALVALVVAFSLVDQPGPLSSTLAPDAFNGQTAFNTMSSLASADPQRRPGSPGDDDVASTVAARFRQYRYQVTNHVFTGATVDGRRTLQAVTGYRAGLGSGSIVLLAHRDSLHPPGLAEASGTAVLLELARVLAGETRHRSIVLVSSSGSDGLAGAAEMANTLPRPIDAVISLGDLAAVKAPGPTIVPWSSGQSVAPLLLRNTVAAALAGQGGIRPGGSGMFGQLVHLALPVTVSEQGPFGARGVPAVSISLAGDHAPAAREAVSESQLNALGRAILISVNALDAGQNVPGPAAYVLFGGKVVPGWALELLVLGLLAPVLVTAVDGLARMRRRGHRLPRGLLWALAGGVPFGLIVALALGAERVGALPAAPPGPVGPDEVPLRSGGVALLIGLAVVLVLSVTLMHRLGRVRAAAEPARAMATLLLLCLVTLGLWAVDPYAALFTVPAVHLWLWLLDPELRPHPALVLTGVVAGLLLPLLLVFGWATTLNLGAAGAMWSGLLLVAGGHIGVITLVLWCAWLGCASGVAVLALRAARRPRPEVTPVTVRGPVTYAGPGSLGGTESALRR